MFDQSRLSLRERSEEAALLSQSERQHWQQWQHRLDLLAERKVAHDSKNRRSDQKDNVDPQTGVLKRRKLFGACKTHDQVQQEKNEDERGDRQRSDAKPFLHSKFLKCDVRIMATVYGHVGV